MIFRCIFYIGVCYLFGLSHLFFLSSFAMAVQSQKSGCYFRSVLTQKQIGNVFKENYQACSRLCMRFIWTRKTCTTSVSIIDNVITCSLHAMDKRLNFSTSNQVFNYLLHYSYDAIQFASIVCCPLCIFRIFLHMFAGGTETLYHVVLFSRKPAKLASLANFSCVVFFYLVHI